MHWKIRMYVIIATCVWGWYNVVIMHTILVEATYAKLASHVWSINEVTVRKSHFNTAYLLSIKDLCPLTRIW